MDKGAAHERLLVDEDGLSSIGIPEKDYDDRNANSFKHSLILKLSFLAQGILLLISVSFFYLSVTRTPTDAQCVNHMSTYSPLLEVKDLVKYQTLNLPLNLDEGSSFRGPPTPEREALWRNIWNLGAIDIPDNKLHLMNKSNNGHHYLHSKPEIGGGVFGFPEVFHRLHCVALLREISYKEYYGPPPLLPIPDYLDGTPEEVRGHVDHCLDVLRWTLMCQSDVTPFLVEKDSTSPTGTKADFQTNHKCRNFWSIHQWVKEHGVFP